jgi:hypothetical protein
MVWNQFIFPLTYEYVELIYISTDTGLIHTQTFFWLTFWPVWRNSFHSLAVKKLLVFNPHVCVKQHSQYMKQQQWNTDIGLMQNMIWGYSFPKLYSASTAPTGLGKYNINSFLKHGVDLI